jgi:MutS domain V
LRYSQSVLAVKEYKQRLKDRESSIARHEQTHIRLGYVRLLLALVEAGLAWESFWRHALSPWWMVVPLITFVFIAAIHSRILQSRRMAQRGASFYQQGLARIEDRWAGAGQTGERFNDPHHVYAADLDLFGRGGLFELLSTARTRMGEETLAAWLLSPSAVDQIEERHAAIAELRDQLDLREDLAILGEDASVGVFPEALLRWAEAPNQMPMWIWWLAAVLSVSAVGGAVLWAVLGTPTPLIVIVLIEAFLAYRLRKPVEEILHGSEQALGDLNLLSGVLARLEEHSFRAPSLQSLQTELSSYQTLSSHAIARLRTIVEFIDSRDNVIVRILNIPLMYSIHAAFAAERWRLAHGHAARWWLRVIGEIEALICLATYSYEHPDDPFPEFVRGGTALFDCLEIGHPLVAAARCVRNDVRLSDGKHVFLVSGSNMSGKSTLLRTVGVNTVLAMAGAPVRAQRLRLTALHVGASIRVNDSLQEGSSRFYAEISRLRALLDLAGSSGPSLLFLLDELLQGTNSNDRRIGAEGIVLALLNRGAIGLVSTHDLALAEIGGSLNGQMCNVHFQEEFENGRMLFDYRLRAGLVTNSNGLALMRSIGLDV